MPSSSPVQKMNAKGSSSRHNSVERKGSASRHNSVERQGSFSRHNSVERQGSSSRHNSVERQGSASRHNSVERGSRLSTPEGKTRKKIARGKTESPGPSKTALPPDPFAVNPWAVLEDATAAAPSADPWANVAPDHAEREYERAATAPARPPPSPKTPASKGRSTMGAALQRVKTRVQSLRERVLSPMFGEMKQAAEVHTHVRSLILKTGPQAQKFYDERFEAHALEIFDAASGCYGLLHGCQLRDAVLDLLPYAHGQTIRAESEEGIRTLTSVFIMLMHESATKGSAGITRALFADFARFCLAWKIYEYYSTPQIKGLKDRTETPSVDVLFIGGPFTARKDNLVARLFMAYHSGLELPIATTSRERLEWEEDGVHHHFKSPRIFAKMDEQQDFLAHHVAEDGEYGYTYFSLMEPSWERKHLCILPSTVDSAAGERLRRREELLGDLRLKTVFCKLPSGAKKPTHAVNGELHEYYANHPDEWSKELGRARSDCWDLVLDGDLSEDAALVQLEQFIEQSLQQKGHKMYETLKKEDQHERLGMHHLYEILATNNYSGFTFVTASHMTHLYDKAAKLGFDDEFLKEFGYGECETLLTEDEWRLIADKYTANDGGRFQLSSFGKFIKDVSEQMQLEEKYIICALVYAQSGHFLVTEDMIQDCFDSILKPYSPGAEFSPYDYTALCRHCGWITTGGSFTQGHAEMVFLHLVRQQRTPARPTLPTQKIRRSTTSKKSLKAVVESEIGKQRICTLEDFEYLFEKTAERQGSSCLTQLRQVRASARQARALGSAGSRSILGAFLKVGASASVAGSRSSSKMAPSRTTSKTTIPGDEDDWPAPPTEQGCEAPKPRSTAPPRLVHGVLPGHIDDSDFSTADSTEQFSQLLAA